MVFRPIREPARSLPVTHSFDVVVVGAGIGGVAAAVAAARCGVSVALVEKLYAVGGLATLGNVNIFLPLCDGLGHQVIKGLGEELLKLSVADNPETIPACWRRRAPVAERCKARYRVRFNPAHFALALEALLVDEGVSVFYDTRFCSVHRRGQRIDAVIVENKDGRTALKARAVIDASGDADVCAAAGEPAEALCTNVRAGWFFHTDGPGVKLYSFSTKFDHEGKIVPDGHRGYAGHRAADVTQLMLDSNALIRGELAKMIQKGPNRVAPITLPTIPSFRMTRRLKGRVEIEAAHHAERFDDAVGMTGDWRKAAPAIPIPLRALAGIKTGNLLTAGRCISAASAWDITRAIPTCAVTGQAAGVAAALGAKAGAKRLIDLDIDTLRGALTEQKVLLP